MSVRHERLRVRTGSREETLDVTERLREIVRSSGIRDGLCLVASTHTTAAVFVNENADPDVQHDLLSSLRKTVPDESAYRHAEGNSPAHIKAILIGREVTLAIRDGDLALGRWQGVFFAELDGPRERTIAVTLIG